MEEWITRHPYVIGAVLAALAGVGTWQAYRSGMAVGEARAVGADAARLASEALGG